MKNFENSLRFEFDLPGYKRENIKVEFEGNSLIISASRNYESEDIEKGFFREEKRKSSFFYESTLPENMDRKNIQVEFKAGILKIEIPKTNA